MDTKVTDRSFFLCTMGSAAVSFFGRSKKNFLFYLLNSKMTVKRMGVCMINLIYFIHFFNFFFSGFFFLVFFLHSQPTQRQKEQKNKTEQRKTEQN